MKLCKRYFGDDCGPRKCLHASPSIIGQVLCANFYQKFCLFALQVCNRWKLAVNYAVVSLRSPMWPPVRHIGEDMWQRHRLHLFCYIHLSLLIPCKHCRHFKPLKQKSKLWVCWYISVVLEFIHCKVIILVGLFIWFKFVWYCKALLEKALTFPSEKKNTYLSFKTLLF